MRQPNNVVATGVEFVLTTGIFSSVLSHWFSAKYTDAESGLVYYGYRYYQPRSGRWWSRDPIEEDGGDNLYIFVANDSIGTCDPFGADFIAVGKRRINITGLGHFGHLSIALYRQCRALAQEGERFVPADLGHGDFVGASLTDRQYELLPSHAYKRYRLHKWWEVPISFVYNHIESPASELVVLYADRPGGTLYNALFTWESYIDPAAQAYPYAEQPLPGHALTNWSNSEYQRFGNNSNTFVYEMGNAVGRNADVFNGIVGNRFAVPVTDSNPAPVYHP